LRPKFATISRMRSPTTMPIVSAMFPGLQLLVRNPVNAHLRDVIEGQHFIARAFQGGDGRLLGKERACRGRFGPRQGIMRCLTIVGLVRIVKGKCPARFQDTAEFAIEPDPVCDIHHHMLAPDDIKAATLEGQLGNASNMVTDFAAEVGAVRKKGGDGHIGRGEIDSSDMTGNSFRKKARRTAKAGSGIKDAHVARDFTTLRQFYGRGKPAHVKLVEVRKFLRRQRWLHLVDDVVELGEQFCLVLNPSLVMVANGFGIGGPG
jgi:hypothetical protein